ncbi:Ribosomal RNA small subunit methyltransferase G [invertebrate metagenome]|uniref:Ribosomal RNA small subunit methyltransferase G n=1 Tax=invertebrate metagenome TaxID=1711999 RepID=A0A2H9T302_9ZZZZ
MPSEKLINALKKGVKQLSLFLTDQQLIMLVNYIELLVKWNKAYNLTAVRDPVDMVSRHILDSLSIAPYVNGRKILDVGSGPGLPGIPLAIMYPERQIFTLDSNGKKTRFMQQAKLDLGLDNVTVVNTRVEEYKPDFCFDVITSRAFSSLQDMVKNTRHLICSEGIYMAMKGVYPEEELVKAEAISGTTLQKIVELSVPGRYEKRCLVVLKNA